MEERSKDNSDKMQEQHGPPKEDVVHEMEMPSQARQDWQNENYQILKESFEIKSQMQESAKTKDKHYDMAMLIKLHQEDMRRYYTYQARVVEQQRSKLNPGIYHHPIVPPTQHYKDDLHPKSSSFLPYDRSSSVTPVHSSNPQGGWDSLSSRDYMGSSSSEMEMPPQERQDWQNENYQILKESFELKSQMEEMGKTKAKQYDMAMLVQENLRRYYTYQARVVEQQRSKLNPGIYHHSIVPPTHTYKKDGLQATFRQVVPKLSSSFPHDSSSSVAPDYSSDPKVGWDSVSSRDYMRSSSSKNESSSNSEGKWSKAELERQKPTMETTGPPLLPTNSTAYLPPPYAFTPTPLENAKPDYSNPSLLSSNSGRGSLSSRGHMGSSSSTNESSSSSEGKWSKAESEGQKPTMETTDPPPLPTNSTAYLPPPYAFTPMPLENAWPDYSNPSLLSSNPSGDRGSLSSRDYMGPSSSEKGSSRDYRESSSSEKERSRDYRESSSSEKESSRENMESSNSEKESCRDYRESSSSEKESRRDYRESSSNEKESSSRDYTESSSSEKDYMEPLSSKNESSSRDYMGSSGTNKESSRDFMESSSSEKDYMRSPNSKIESRSNKEGRGEKKRSKAKKVASEGKRPNSESMGPPPPFNYTFSYNDSTYLPPQYELAYMAFAQAAMYHGGINPRIMSPHCTNFPYPLNPQIRYRMPPSAEQTIRSPTPAQTSAAAATTVSDASAVPPSGKGSTSSEETGVQGGGP